MWFPARPADSCRYFNGIGTVKRFDGARQILSTPKWSEASACSDLSPLLIDSKNSELQKTAQSLLQQLCEAASDTTQLDSNDTHSRNSAQCDMNNHSEHRLFDLASVFCLETNRAPNYIRVPPYLVSVTLFAKNRPIRKSVVGSNVLQQPTTATLWKE